MEAIEGQIDFSFEACIIVSNYLGDQAVSNWRDYRHCQYHMRDTWEIVGLVEFVEADSQWKYKVWGPKDVVQ